MLKKSTWRYRENLRDTLPRNLLNSSPKALMRSPNVLNVSSSPCSSRKNSGLSPGWSGLEGRIGATRRRVNMFAYPVFGTELPSCCHFRKLGTLYTGCFFTVFSDSFSVCYGTYTVLGLGVRIQYILSVSRH